MGQCTVLVLLLLCAFILLERYTFWQAVMDREEKLVGALNRMAREEAVKRVRYDPPRGACEEPPCPRFAPPE